MERGVRGLEGERVEGRMRGNLIGVFTREKVGMNEWERIIL